MFRKRVNSKYWRKFTGAFAVGAVAASSFAALNGVAVAETASGGASIHKENVFWWTFKGSGTNDFVPYLLEAGKDHTSTSVSKIGDSELAVTCTISNLGPVGLAAKAPSNASVTNGSAADKGGWKGESHGLLYNSGNANNNLLANGLVFGGPNSNLMKNRLMKAGVKAEFEAGQGKNSANPGPWTRQVLKYGGEGAIDNSGNLVTNSGTIRWTWPEETEFDLSCTATLDGVSVPLDGLVLANAESNGNYNKPEWQEFTPQGEGADTATWHALDIWNACDPSSDEYTISDNNVLRNHPAPGMKECPNAATKSASSSAILSGATSVHVKMHEDVTDAAAGAIAVGVYLSSDFGDAPQSYGVAANYWAGTWDNTLERGNSYVLRNLAGATDQGGVYKTGSKTAPDYYLGATRDTEQPKNIVLNKYAKGDDSHNDDGSGGDEDGFAPGPDADLTDDLSTSGGTTTYSTDVQCTANNGTGYVGGWIDWNMDGAFDMEGEQATAQCTGGTAKLTWNVPANKVIPWPGSPDFGNPSDPWSYLRLRISSQQEDIKPEGVGTGEGEVEDYRVTWNTPVKLAKTSYTDPADVDKMAGTTYGWEVTLTNTGNLDYTDAYPMEMWDDLEDAYNHMDEITLVSVEGGGSASINPDTKQLTWKGPLPAGKSVKLKYQGVITKYDDGRLQNAASSAYDPDHAETVTDSLAKLEITKDSSATTVNADGTVDYTIKVTNNGKNNTPIRSGSLLDDLSDVLDDGEVIPSSITATIGTAKLEGSRIKWSLGGGAVLKKGETATITYTVKINKRDGNGKAINKVTLDNAYSDQENTSTTTTDVINPPLGDDRVTVGKKGEKQSTTIEDMFEKGTGDITDYALVDPETGETTDTVTIPGQGTYTIEDGKVVFTPEPGYEGTPTPVKVRATDSNGLTAEGEYQPHVLGEGTASRTITYKYLDENGQEASTTVVQKTEFEQVPVLGDDGKPQFNDDGTPKFEWKVKDGQSDTLNQVDSPDLSAKGWTPNKSSIPAVQVKPGDTLEEVVVYTPQPPVATPDVTYGAKDQPQTGTPKFEVTTSTTPDGTPNEITKISLLDKDGNPATTVTVPEGTYVLNEDGTITFTPNEGFVGDPEPVKVRGTDKNGQSAETTYTPHVKDNVQKDSAKRTITYTYLTEDGKTASDTVVQEVNFERTGTVDPKTGDVTWPDWTPQPVDKVDSPTIKGWTPDKTVIDATNLKPGDNIVENVVYTPEPPVGTPDETYGGKDQPQTGTPKFKVTTSTTPDGTPNEIVKTELLDENGNPATEVTVPEGKYTLNEDGTITFTPNEGFVGDPKPVKVRGTDKNGQSDVTEYTPHVVDNVQTDTAKRTVKYWYKKINGEVASKDIVQTVPFKRTGTVDPKTGEVTWPDWTPQPADKVDSPKIKGWTPDKTVIDATNLKPGDNIVEDVIYTTTWVTYVDEDGTIYLEKTDLDKDGNEPPAPKDPTKEGYTFDGWDRSVDENGNITYTARWKKVDPTPEPTPSDDPSDTPTGDTPTGDTPTGDTPTGDTPSGTPSSAAPTSSTQPPVRQTPLVNTGSAVGLGALLALSLAAFGSVLLGARRREER